MAEFRTTPGDFDEVVQRQQLDLLRKDAPYSVGALAAGILFVFVAPPLAWFSLGMFAAWGYSLTVTLRSLRNECLWRFEFMMLEPVTVHVTEKGMRITHSQGAVNMEWDDRLTVKALKTCFVVQEDSTDTFVVPKRYLDATELLLLQNRATRALTYPVTSEQI